MKRILFGTSALVLLSGLGLAGCRAKEDPPEDTPATGQIPHVASVDYGANTNVSITDSAALYQSSPSP